jgi:hypothetical protein
MVVKEIGNTLQRLRSLLHRFGHFETVWYYVMSMRMTCKQVVPSPSHPSRQHHALSLFTRPLALSLASSSSPLMPVIGADDNGLQLIKDKSE